MATWRLEVVAFYDAAADEYAVNLFTLIENENWTELGRPTIEEAVELWYEWLTGTTFTVTPHF